MTDATETPIAAALEHLTGPCRGEYSWVTSDEAAAWFGKRAPFHVILPGQSVPGAECVARFRRRGDSFAIEATEACDIWVNREPVTRKVLTHGDMIEFGADGPLSRIRIYSDRHGPDLTITDILGDTRSYIRASRRPLLYKLARGLLDASQRVLFQTTVLFRVGIMLLLAAILVLLFWQWRTDQTLMADVDRQVQALSRDVARTREEALRPSDLAAMREELSGSLDANRERLDTLEAQRAAATRIIAAAQPHVAFLQAAYGLRHTASGQMLRHQLGPDGLPRLSVTGKPLFTLEGDGPVAEAQITGTGFLAGDTGLLITNRHVALPWEDGDQGASQEMEPVMLQFQAWFPGAETPVPVQTLAVSDSFDLAVLKTDRSPSSAGLPIAIGPSQPGEVIIVMGYPTGLRSLLAQSGEAFVAALQADGETGFWEVAARLAREGLIAPLSTRGIIGRVSTPTMVYDAETTHGGSGGPVLNMQGEVVAVNTAIIPEFGGSNLGVPAEHIRALLAVAQETQ